MACERRDQGRLNPAVHIDPALIPPSTGHAHTSPCLARSSHRWRMIDVPAMLPLLPPVFDLPEAVSAGLSARVVERAVRHGDVRRLARGVFVAKSRWLQASRRDRHLLLVDAAVRRQPQAVVSHHSAALLHSLPIPWHLPGWVALTTNGSTRTATPRTLLRLEPAGLPQADIDHISGLTVTSVDRTVVDCLRELPLPDAVAICLLYTSDAADE